MLCSVHLDARGKHRTELKRPPISQFALVAPCESERHVELKLSHRVDAPLELAIVGGRRGCVVSEILTDISLKAIHPF